MNARVHPEATAASLSEGADYELLAQRFRPIFARIAEGAVERERQRELPHEAVAWLKQAGFGAVRVPREHGGAGASLPQLVQLLIELAEADSNIAEPGPGRDRWLRRFVEGDLVGCAWTEVGSVRLGEVLTRVSRKDDGRWVVNGSKYYSTGSLFSDWIDLYAQRDDTGADVIAAIRTDQPGVRQSDDWDGFGQRTTGSGTSLFEDAEVEEENLIDFASRFKYQTAFYQLVLLAVLAGTGRAALRDVAAEVRGRTRIYSHGNAPRVSQDPQVQQVVGRIAARVYAAEAATLRAAEAAQRAYLARFVGDPQAEKEANIAAEIESAKAQAIVAELVLQATSELFDASGASAVGRGKQLDRHWRNARTAASHNPLIYKQRIVGDWEINGSEPPYVWQIGSGPATASR